MEPSRVKILESKYQEDSDLVIWLLHFLDTGDEQKFCWPSVDLMSSLNINSKNIEVEHLHKFCLDMVGKEINFVVEGLPECKLPDMNDIKINEGIVEHFDTFKEHADG